MSKDDIRKTFKVEDKYKAHRDFLRYVITNPLDNEVNKKSNINLEIYETKKQGRSVVGFTFKVTSKEPKKAISKDKAKRPLTKKQADKYASMIVSHCDKNNNNPTASEVHKLSDDFGRFDSWYNAQSLIWKELQDLETMDKYKDILEILGFNRFNK